ncbi:MAG: WXG100 family type VII secretion target [Clostridiales bacterium]|nr:WXG100 family type VII secretion target [Clostridiales bacterium]
MENNLLVTPQELRNAASTFQTQAGQIQTLHETMRTKVANLSSTWTGSASETYLGKFNELKTAMDKIYNTITEHVKDLNTIADQYENAENQVVGLASDLPPVNL